MVSVHPTASVSVMMVGLHRVMVNNVRWDVVKIVQKTAACVSPFVVSYNVSAIQLFMVRAVNNHVGQSMTNHVPDMVLAK
jgi:hypothetical protein